jgi:formylglycine-generating enzyme required for sulfatase activity
VKSATLLRLSHRTLPLFGGETRLQVVGRRRCSIEVAVLVRASIVGVLGACSLTDLDALGRNAGKGSESGGATSAEPGGGTGAGTGGTSTSTTGTGGSTTTGTGGASATGTGGASATGTGGATTTGGGMAGAGGDAGAASSSVGPGGGGATPDPCGGTAGPVMVDLGDYCIDTTEVTNAQYKAFLDAGPVVTQPTYCQWNTSFVPAANWYPFGKDAHPVAHVDWCDAYAYCEWAGKRLCGKVGGGANTTAETTANNNQWYSACSSAGVYKYPYGDTYQGTTCNGVNYGASGTIAVGAATGCHGLASPFSELFDMSGNVAEWTDACFAQSGATDSCQSRGASYSHNSTTLLCTATLNAQRKATAAFRGFRCCSDP